MPCPWTKSDGEGEIILSFSLVVSVADGGEAAHELCSLLCIYTRQIWWIEVADLGISLRGLVRRVVNHIDIGSFWC